MEHERMTKEQALDALHQLKDNRDIESGHIEADGILCAFLRHLGHDDVSSAFERLEKWYA